LWFFRHREGTFVLRYLKEFDRVGTVYATVGMSPESPGSERVWAVVYVQEGRRMIHTQCEADELSYDETLLVGISRVVPDRVFKKGI
jgi:hypothetical protein